KAVRLLWFVLFAASIGPVIQKLGLQATNSPDAPMAVTFVQALMMIGLWLLFGIARRNLPVAELTKRHNIVTAAMVSLPALASNVLSNMAYLQVEHPAYLTVILLTDALWVLLVYRGL